MDNPGTDRFYCDVMLGKLARELRLLGLDVKYERVRGGMAAYKQARAEGRVFLTRNSKTRSLPSAFFVESQVAAEQVEQVRRKYGSGAAPAAAPEARRPATQPQPGNRCIEDNEPLQRISRDQARPAIPFYIFQIHHEFHRCPKCGRVYWPGSHLQNMVARLARTEPPKERHVEEREPAEPQPARPEPAEAGTAPETAAPAQGEQARQDRRPRRRYFRRGPRRRPGPAQQQGGAPSGNAG